MSTKSHKGAAFDWADPFLLNDQLSEEERMIRDSAAAFAADRLAPRIKDAYLNETTDPEIFREMGAAGLLGVTVAEEYGGVGASYVSYGLVAREQRHGVMSGDPSDKPAIASVACGHEIRAAWMDGRPRP